MITVNSPELARFRVAADRVDKRIVPQIRKSLRNLGKPMVDEIQDTVREGGKGGESTDQIAAGTRFAVSFSRTGGGLKVTTTNARLDAEHKGFVAAFNKPSFRHPVHGNRGAWVEQTGRPYFGVSIQKVFDVRAQKEMEAVFREAVKAIGGRI